MGQNQSIGITDTHIPVDTIIEHMTFDQLYDFCKDDDRKESICNFRAWWIRLVRHRFGPGNKLDDPRSGYMLGILDKITLRELNMVNLSGEVIYSDAYNFYKIDKSLISSKHNRTDQSDGLIEMDDYYTNQMSDIVIYKSDKLEGRKYIYHDREPLNRLSYGDLERMIAHKEDEVFVLRHEIHENYDVSIPYIIKMKRDDVIDIIRRSEVFDYSNRYPFIYIELPEARAAEDSYIIYKDTLGLEGVILDRASKPSY